MSDSNSKYTFKKIAVAGCLTFVVGALGIGMIIEFYLIPQYERHVQARVCWTDRRSILDQEELFRQKSPMHEYTTDLQKLNTIHLYYTCPEDGVYSVVIKNGHAQVHCSIKEHDALTVP